MPKGDDVKILVVDDDELILALAADALRTAGFEDVTLAASAKEAVKVVTSAAQPFDCFLLDILMPEIDGIELCRWLRLQPAYVSTRVIMVTARSDKAHIDRAFAAGASDYVTKPLDISELCSKLLVIEKATRAQPRLRAVAGRGVLEPTRFAFSEPQSIGPVMGVLEYQALQNYLLRISRSGLFVTRIFAFKIRGIGRIYATSEPRSFTELLTEVARAITASLKTTEFFVSYAGEGAFVCIARGRSDYDLEKLEFEVNRLLRNENLTDEMGLPLDVKVCAGSQIRGGLMRSGRSVLSALTLAVQTAEKAAYALLEDADPLLGRYGSFDVADAHIRAN